MARRIVGGKKFSFRPFLDNLKNFDYIQIAATVALLAAGLVFIYSTGRQVGTAQSMHFWAKQLQWILLGVCCWGVFALADYRRFKPLSIIFYLACLALLLAVLFWGVKINGARRWLVLSQLGIRLQPSEFAKLAVIFLLSVIFAANDENINKVKYLILAALVALAPFLLIVREPDLGSALILIPLSGAIIFAAGLKWKYIIITLSVAGIIIGAEVANEIMEIKPLLKEYQKERILTFLDPERDVRDRGYNQHQARLAVGSGGLRGKGIGQGTQNTLGFLPQSVSNNDFIFSVIAEETGFIGCMALLAAYIFLLYSMLRTALITADKFGKYLAVGLAAVFFTHSFINMGMSIGIAPVTGLCLPFVSYGGSFILFAMCGLGVLQSIYRHRMLEE